MSGCSSNFSIFRDVRKCYPESPEDLSSEDQINVFNRVFEHVRSQHCSFCWGKLLTFVQKHKLQDRVSIPEDVYVLREEPCKKSFKQRFPEVS